VVFHPTYAPETDTVTDSADNDSRTRRLERAIVDG
jgi:hypothetical protein